MKRVREFLVLLLIALIGFLLLLCGSKEIQTQAVEVNNESRLAMDTVVPMPWVLTEPIKLPIENLMAEPESIEGEVTTSKLNGTATWYGNEYHGNLTASGEVFNENGFTAASNTLPFGTKLNVYYDGKTIQVTINDRGGFTHELDLSKGAFRELAPLSRGVIQVDFAIVE